VATRVSDSVGEPPAKKARVDGTTNPNFGVKTDTNIDWIAGEIKELDSLWTKCRIKKNLQKEDDARDILTRLTFVRDNLDTALKSPIANPLTKNRLDAMNMLTLAQLASKIIITAKHQSAASWTKYLRISLSRRFPSSQSLLWIRYVHRIYCIQA